MNQNNELNKALKELMKVNSIVSGNEGLLIDIFSSVADKTLKGAKVVGGKLADGLITLFRKANKALVLNYGQYRTQLEHALKIMKEDEETEGVKFTKSVLSKITTTGEVDDIKSSIKLLIETLKDIDKYRLELESFYQKEISLFSDYKSVKDTESAVKLIKKMDELELPLPKLKKKQDNMSLTELLPGGKIIKFDNSKYDFFIETETVTGKETEEVYSKDQIKEIIGLLYDLDEIYRVVNKANENYIAYLNKFNSVVKDAFVHISSLDSKISSSLLRDLQSRLEGNPKVFHFYSGFLPRVMTYVDSVMSSASEFINKQFN